MEWQPGRPNTEEEQAETSSRFWYKRQWPIYPNDKEQIENMTRNTRQFASTLLISVLWHFVLFCQHPNSMKSQNDKWVLLYGKQFSSLNRVFWLVSFRSGFYSTDHCHGNGPFWIFFFRGPAPAKFKLRKRKKIKKGKVWSWYKTNEQGKHVCLEKALFN